MLQIAQGWILDVERGPDWLFVRPQHVPPDAVGDPPLAEHVWSILEQSFTRRLVLELDELDHINSHFIGQMVRLHKRICAQGGVMRICGLSSGNQSVLNQCRLGDRFPTFPSRTEAVMGSRPKQPR